MNIGILYAYVAFVCSIVIIVIKNRVSALSGNTTFQKPFSKLLNFFIAFTVIDGTWGIFFSNAIIKSYYCLEFFTYGFHFCAALSAFMWAGYMSDFLKVSPHVKKIINYTRCIIFTIQLYILISNLFTHYAFNITRDCSYLPTPYRNISFYVQFSYYAFILIFTLINLHLQKNNNEKKVMHRTALFFSTVPLIFGFGQMLFSDAPFYSMGFMLVSVAIYGFNVTAEREKVIHQLHQKEQNKLGSIVEALSSNYQAIYYVDLETNTYQSIISDPRFVEKVTSKMDTSSPDFFETLVKNASKVLYPDDKNYVLTKLTKENLLHELETNTSFTITYRISIDKIPIYYQMKCVFSTIPNETKKVIIGVYDIDNQVHEQQQTSEIISAVGEAFESIYLVNTLNDTFEIYRCSEYLANYYNDENIPYSVAINQYIDKDVHPNYREVLRKYTNLKFIKDKLKDKKTIDISFYDIHTGEDLYYEMRIVKPQKYEANGKIIIGFINRNEVILQRQREVFITGLADDYDSVYYGNILDDSFENIRSTIEFRKNHPQYKEHMTYTDFLEAAKNFIHPDDLAPFMIEMSKENIAFKLNQDKSFYISYRQVINNTIRYYRIKIIRTENWEKKKEFMLGTSNVDELIRSRIAFQEEDARKTSVLQSMANSYVSICYIDTETQEYIPYFGTTEIQKWYSASKYTEAFENYVNNSVLPEYRFQLLAAVSPDNLQRNTENKNSSDNNSAFLTIPFQDNHTGTPLYYELALIRVDSTHIISSIQNRDYIIRKENEQRRTLADAKDKAEAASRAKSTFLFNMSHDIRTPMNAIKGFIELAERNINSKTKISDYLSKIKTSSDHLLHLINDVLDMSRIESGKVTIDEAPTNIKTETENLISIVNVSAIEKDIELTYDISKLKDYYIYSDQLHVTQILLNVLTNAIKYTKAGGKIHYSIEQTDDSTNTVAAYKITVQDNGIGMSPDFVSQIFEEFARASNTTKSKVEGTGLGMSIVKRLVDMMGGQIDIDTELGKGTTVTIHLNFRICDSVSTENTEISEQSENTFLKGKRLLLVEDNDFNREIAREILEDEGLLIEEAEDGTIAVEKVQNHPANYYDIVLMDIQMPYMDGYTATKTIRNLNNDDYSKLPIIAMTANAFEEDIQNAIDAGMNGHLSKPIEIPRLLDCLNKIASKRL